MTPSAYGPGTTRLRVAAAASATAAAALLASAAVVWVAPDARAAAVNVPLGTASSYAVLAGAGITNTGNTVLDGDVGTFPTTSITGTASLTVTGVNHGGDAVTQGAKDDLTTAYDTAAGEMPPSVFLTDLGGQTLVAGVYQAPSSAGLTGALTLDAQGDPDAVFVFQIGSSLTTASASSVLLQGGAQACNVFWQVGSSATFGSATDFTGNVLALSDITLNTNVTVVGRVLARNGTVTLDADTVTRPSCATATASPSPVVTTPTPSAAPSGSPSPSASPSASGAATGSPVSSAAPSPVVSTSARTPSMRPSTAFTIPPAGPDAAGGLAAAHASGGTGVVRVHDGTRDTAVTRSRTHQVGTVPTGGVHAGDGSARGHRGGLLMGMGVVSLGADALLGALGLLARRRTT